MALGERELLEGSVPSFSQHHYQQTHHQEQQERLQNQQMVTQKGNDRSNVGVMGSRRIFAPSFKLRVLDSYRNDIDCRGNQRATARKYGIHRRQIQKWLQCEKNLRSCCADNKSGTDAIALNNEANLLINVSESLSSSNSDSPPLKPISPYYSALPFYHSHHQPIQTAPVHHLPTTEFPVTGCSVVPKVQVLQKQVPQAFSSSSDYSDKDSEERSTCSSSDSEVEFRHGGRRRSFSLKFKLGVLDAFHKDYAVAGNQRATARKYGINRRQVQKWLGQESELRGVVDVCGPKLGSVMETNIASTLASRVTCTSACCNSNNNNNNSGKRKIESTSLCAFSCCSGGASLSPEPTTKKTRNQESAEQAKEHNVQETPLCLVKPKSAPVAPSANRDAILFKPYLDNPVCRPADDCGTRTVGSPLGSSCANRTNLQMNLKMPEAMTTASWKLPTSCFSEIQSPLKSAFMRYTAGARYV